MTETAAPISNDQLKTSNKGVSGLFQSKWINNNLGFFLYIALLAVVYIAYGHWTDKTIRSINNSQKSINDLQYEYKTVKSEVMMMSEEGEVVKASTPLGLHLSKEMPRRIKLESKTKN